MLLSMLSQLRSEVRVICMACVVCEQPLQQENDICPECIELLQKTSRLFDRTLMLHSREWHKMRVLGSYEGLLAKLISKAKFGHRAELFVHLANLLGSHVQEHLISDSFTAPDLFNSNVLNSKLLMTSVPMPFWRKFRRGFNQSELIMQQLSKQLGNDTNDQLVQHTGSSRVQHFLNKQQRLSNRQHVFHCVGEVPKRVIVVDDVITTGATMSAICQRLKAGGAEYIEVWALALTPK